jgi:hypothetical protein
MESRMLRTVMYLFRPHRLAIVGVNPSFDTQIKIKDFREFRLTRIGGMNGP